MGGGRGYSEFCLLHRLGLFWGVRIFNFTIIMGLGKVQFVCVWAGGGG